jgi:Xaa-Pro aminopeptidase
MSTHTTTPAIPFDPTHLDRLMDDAGLDVLLATSRANTRYLLGGHQSNFYESFDAVGITRYLPIVVYPKGAPDKTLYVANRMEKQQFASKPIWVPEVNTSAGGTLDAMRVAIEHLRRLGLAESRVGIETAFLPMEAGQALAAVVSPNRLSDALFVLERLRARKSPRELSLLREASERVIASMLAVINSHGPGSTKQEIADALRREETDRGLVFDYCLIAAGSSHNRAPSDQRWETGEVLSLDSGGNYHGYIGDLARMAILGEPDAELEDLLAEIEAVQQAAFRVVRPGLIGGEIFEAAHKILEKSPNQKNTEFVAHGMGLVTHEAPRLTDTGPVKYPAYDAPRPLEPGMVLSIETTMQHPRRGFIKLEDTVAVTPGGYEIFGNDARGWNRRPTLS